MCFVSFDYRELIYGSYDAHRKYIVVSCKLALMKRTTMIKITDKMMIRRKVT